VDDRPARARDDHALRHGQVGQPTDVHPLGLEHQVEAERHRFPFDERLPGEQPVAVAGVGPDEVVER